MFTGIIEETGEIIELKRESDSLQIIIRAEKILINAIPGDSIAVNGVCVTATVIKENQFSADISPETLHKTDLNEYIKGDIVNLERALKIGERFGGHIVTGHIDGTGRIYSKKVVGKSIILTMKAIPDLRQYIAKKGSIAIDGISLTITDSTDAFFSVSLIPFTLENTTLQFKQPGDLVNIECDILSKYVEQLLLCQNKINNQKISENLLKKTGFI